MNPRDLDPDAETVKYTHADLAWARGEKYSRVPIGQAILRSSVIAVLFVVAVFWALPRIADDFRNANAQTMSAQVRSEEGEFGLLRLMLDEKMVKDQVAYLAIDANRREDGMWQISPHISLTVDGKAPQWSQWGGVIKVKTTGSRVVITDIGPGYKSVYESTLMPGGLLWYETASHSLQANEVKGVERDQLISIAQFRPQYQVEAPCTNRFGFYCSEDRSSEAVAARHGFVRTVPVNFEGNYMEGYNVYRYVGNSVGLNTLNHSLRESGASWVEGSSIGFIDQENRKNYIVTLASMNDQTSLGIYDGRRRGIVDIRKNVNAPYLFIQNVDPNSLHFVRSLPDLNGYSRTLQLAAISLNKLEPHTP